MKEGASRNVLRGIIQHDTLNEVNIRLSDGSRAFDYTGYTNIIFKVLKADGTSYIAAEGESVIATSPVDGIVTVILAGQATTVAGMCQSVIEIYSGADKMTTARFNYEVFESLGVDEAAVSEDHYPVFQTLLTDLSELEANVESAEEQRVSAEAARASTASGYVARAEQAAADAEMWARAAQDIADGDYATRAELEAVAEGAAPAGYGLGGAARLLTANDDLNNITESGLYMYSADIGIPKNIPDTSNAYLGGYGLVSVMAYRIPNCVVQIIYNMYNAKTDNVSIMRTIDGTVGEWEWVNPPMQLDVEYRTTERYMGKPVYALLVDVGAAPSTGYAEHAVSTDVASNVETVIRAEGNGVSADGNCLTLPAISGTLENFSYVPAIGAMANTNHNLSVYVGNLAGMTNIRVLVHYTKTTD